MAVAVAVLLSGCSAASEIPDHGEQRAAAPAGLSGDLVQQRRDVESGAVQVELTLDPEAPAVDVASVRLRTSAFPDAVRGTAVLVPPGFTIDVPVSLGAPVCSDDTSEGVGADASDGATLPATAELALADGSTADVALPDAAGYLARIHATACTAQRTAAVVPAAWDPAWTTTGAGADLRAVGVLHLGPVAAGHRVDLREVTSTPLFSWRLRDAAAPVFLGAGQSADLAVVLDPARCDAHAVADDKRGFGPELVLAVDGAAPVRVRAWVPRSDRATATDALLAACAAGGATA